MRVSHLIASVRIDSKRSQMALLSPCRGRVGGETGAGRARKVKGRSTKEEKSELEGEGVHREGDDAAYRSTSILPSWYFDEPSQAFPTSPLQTFLQSLARGDASGSLWAVSSSLVRFAAVPSVMLAVLSYKAGELADVQRSLGFFALAAAFVTAVGVAGEASKLLKLISNVGRRGGGKD